MHALGTDIYGQHAPARDVYAITGQVQPGNSGGPLLSTTGRVVGTVFAKSARGAPTGYVLTLDESRPVIEKARHSTAPVPTGACVERAGLRTTTTSTANTARRTLIWARLHR